MPKFKLGEVVGSKKTGRRWGTIVDIPSPGYIVQWLNKQWGRSVHSETDLYKETVDEKLICYTCENSYEPCCNPRVKKWGEWLSDEEIKREKINILRGPNEKEIKELNKICFACLRFKESK